MIRRFENGDSINTICRDFRISRTIFYNWLKKYKKSNSNIEVLKNRRPSGNEHWRFISGLNEIVADFITIHPECSLNQIH